MEKIDISEIRKSSGSFSFIDTLGNLVVNDRFARGYKELMEKNSNNENTFIWRSLSAIGEDIGNVLYENVRHYIENVSDVDTCTVKSLASLAKELGIVQVKILDNLHAVPTDVLKLVDLFSINPSLMLNPDLINLPLVEELAVCCTVSSYVNEISRGVRNQITSSLYNTELSNATISWGINNELFYNNYLSSKFYDYLTSVVSCEFITSDLVNDVPDRRHYYIFDEIPKNTVSGVVIEKSNSYEYLDSICSSDISAYIQLNNLSPYFNPSEILDNIDNGTAKWEDYSDVERQLLSGVQSRRERALFSLSGDRVLPQTSRYDYYKARKILDLLLFVNNLLGYGAKITTKTWLPDTKYSELQVEYGEDYGVVTVDPDSPPHINDDVLKDAARTLAAVCHSIETIRERLKTFTQQVYLRGSTLLMDFIINEYLRYTLPYRYTKFTSAITDLSNGWLSTDTYENVDVIEYWDTTEYYNLSTQHSSYAKNYGYVNYPFWLRPDDDSSTRIIPRGTINDFYMKMLGMNTVLSSKGDYTLSNFLSTIYSMGLMDAYIDSELSTLVLPVDQTAPSALNTTNLGIISTLREYQRFLTHTYSGLSSGAQPYHNWKNVTHPSWQVHPYLKNFIEKSDTDNVIETTYNITANSFRLAAMRTPKISVCVGIAGEILNLWRYKTEDFSGYLTRYELGRQSLLKWNMEPSPVVNYDGLFYPDAVDDYINIMSTRNDVPMQVVENGKSTIKNVPAVDEMMSCMYGRHSYYTLSGSRVETFYGKWYSHLQGGFETSAFICRTADQLSVYSNELSDIYLSRDFKNVDPYAILGYPVDERPIDIYKYALDKYLNSYILVKRCHPKTPEHIKKMIPGQLWIRFANHPIALPAFGLPDEYLSCYDDLAYIIEERKLQNPVVHPDLPQIGMHNLNKSVVNYLREELLGNIKTKWDFVYDFDITVNGNTVVLAVDAPGATDRESRDTEEKLKSAWQNARILIGVPDRRFDTTPPQYTLRGNYERPILCTEEWKFAGLFGTMDSSQDSVRALYLRYNPNTTTINFAEANVPYQPYVFTKGSRNISNDIDPTISIPSDWDFDWNITVNYCAKNYDDLRHFDLRYMIVGKVPFFPDDLRAPLSVQNWYGRSLAEMYDQNFKQIADTCAFISNEIDTTWMEEGPGIGHTYPTLDDYYTAVHDFKESVKLSVDKLETMMNMPGFTDYAYMPLSVSKAVTSGKEFTWNSAERFDASVLKLFFDRVGTLQDSNQYIINSDASYIPLYPGTDGATRTWPVDNYQISSNVRNWLLNIKKGVESNVTEAYSNYWRQLSEDQVEREIAEMAENALVNSKQPVAAQNMGPEYDGLYNLIDTVNQELSTAINNDGEKVLVGSTVFTGSDALYRVIEEYDENKYYDVWIKPDATKPTSVDTDTSFDIHIPISHLSVINGDPNQKASDIDGLSSWNFLVYNIDSPNVPLAAEPILTTLDRSPEHQEPYDWNLSTFFEFTDKTTYNVDLSGSINKSKINEVGLKNESGWIKDPINIAVGTQVSCIGEEVFASCNRLTSIVIPNSVINIENRAFADCSNLSIIYVATNDTNRIKLKLEASGFDTTEINFTELPLIIPDTTAVNYVNVPTSYQKYFLEHLRVKEDLTAIDGNRDLFATGTDRDNTTTNYFMGISAVTMECNVGSDRDLPVSAWEVVLHFERDADYIKNHFVVDRRQILAFLYSTDFSQFEDYHYLQHHDIWPYATRKTDPGKKEVNERVDIDSEDPDSAYSTYLNAGNRLSVKNGEIIRPFTTDLYPSVYSEGYHLSSVSAYSEFPGPILSGSLAFKINEESRSDLPNMYPDFLFYQTMASAFNLVVTDTQDGDIFALSNTYIMEIVDPSRMVDAIGTFDVLTYDTHSDQVFMRAYEDYMSEQYSISKYDRDVIPYLKWYNAIQPHQQTDHLKVYSEVSTAWISERRKNADEIHLGNISSLTIEQPDYYGLSNAAGFSYGWLSSEEFDTIENEKYKLCADLSSVVEAVGHGVGTEIDGKRELHTFAPAGATFANTMGKRWVTATWDELKNGCKLFINYEKDANSVPGFTLYFNYNNFFYSEYLYMDSNHTFHSCYKPTTYLMLPPGKTGQLEIIAQPKVYSAAGEVCGIRDIRMFTFTIKNTSDDKPKFDIIKTYELAKGGLPQLEYPEDAGVPGAVMVETVEKEVDIELSRPGLFDFVTTDDFEVVIPGDIIDNYGIKSLSCDFLYEGFNPYLVCNFDKCVGGYFTDGGFGRIHFETTHIASFALSFTVLAGQYVSENELNFQIPIEVESAYGMGSHNDIIKMKGIPGGANITFVGETTDSRGLAKEPRPYVVPRNNRDHGGFVLSENGSTLAKGKPIAVFTPEDGSRRRR